MPDPHSRQFRTRGQGPGPPRAAEPPPSPPPEELFGEWLEGDEPIPPEPDTPEPVEASQVIAVPIPASLWERARLQAEAGGFGSLEEYAAEILRAAILSRGEAVRIEPDPEILDPEAEGVEGEGEEGPATAIALVDWGTAAAGLGMEAETEVDSNRSEREEIVMDGANVTTGRSAPEEVVALVLHHAAPGVYDPSSFLAALRRGEPPEPGAARELLDALAALERSYQGEGWIERRVAFALHRLAFEGQVLLTDAWGRLADAQTVSLLRAVQEAVDRVLSGEDIRYDQS